MDIEVKTSNELNITDWQSYTDSFNEVFQKAFTVNDFKHKYINTVDGFSYHVLLKYDNKVVGGFTAIPYEYFIENEIVRVGFPLDVFILSDYRKDFLTFYKMYQVIKKELIVRNIDLVIVTPNYDSYQYWRKVIKMNDVGLLRYYALPLRVGNVVTSLPKFFNKLSLCGSAILILFSNLMNFKEKLAPIRLNRSNDIVEMQRYTYHHNKILIKNAFFSYRIVNEEGVITCYLIDFYNSQKKIKDSYSLGKAIKYISSLENVDLILFIGKISFFQNLLFKIPFKIEPKHLYFMADVINHEKIKNSAFVYDFKNWDFGLFNYDVR